MRSQEPLVFVMIGAALLGGSAIPAQAGSARAQLQSSEFYAYAADEVDLRRVGAGGSRPTSCYISFSVTEASRGIRHWTGKC
jgi:hypothetical protein